MGPVWRWLVLTGCFMAEAIVEGSLSVSQGGQRSMEEGCRQGERRQQASLSGVRCQATEEGRYGCIQQARRDTRDGDGRGRPPCPYSSEGAAKLVQDRQRAEQQWQDYMQDSKAAYIRERDRFHRAMDHFTKEILEAREFQRQARAVLRHVALEDEERKDMETEEATVEDDEWDRMVKDWEEERESVDDGVLRRALLARETRSTTPAPPTRSVARSPAVPREAAEKRQDSSYRPMHNESSPVHQARSDPYSMTSPRMEVGRGESLGRPAEPFTSGMSPVPPGHQTGQDTAMGGQPERPAGAPMGLAEKLQAKRNALRPFGIPPGLATGDTAMKPPVHLEDDDPDLDGPSTEERPSE
eukprot:s732_g12.t1